MPDDYFKPPSMKDADFKKLSHFIESHLGIKMPPAKRVMLESRLNKRLRALKIRSYKEYIDYLFSAEGKIHELPDMIDVVTTNKTDFFREKGHFDYMTETMLDEVFGRKSQIKIWSAAASSGMEPYTLVMVCEEYKEGHPGFDYSILGTDISTEMLESCRKAVYPEPAADPIPLSMKKKYLLRSKDKSAKMVRVKPHLRAKAFFQRLNLMSESYTAVRDSFDVIFCRNVLIYFERANQEAILGRLVDHLNPGGYLFLGHSETLTGSHTGLKSVSATVYQKQL